MVLWPEEKHLAVGRVVICWPAIMVDCCMVRPKRVRNACLHTPEWGSIEDWILESGLVDHSQEKI